MELPKKSDFVAYRAAVLRHWFALVAFVFFTILASFSDLASAFLGDFVMPSWVYYTIGFLAFFVAQFLAWMDMKKERDAERRAKQKLSDRLKEHEIKKETLSKLAHIRDRLISLQNEAIQSGIELGKWISRFEGVRQECRDILEGGISHAECRLYDHIGLFPTYEAPTPGLSDEEHAKYINYRGRVIRDHRWLTSLIIDCGRQKIRSEEIEGARPGGPPPNDGGV